MENKNKQTAVEWLFEKINMFCMFTDGIPDEWSEAFEQAKEMEKQQMIQLPSDEEIDEVINPLNGEMDEFDLGFRNGAKWVRDKIIGGNK